MGVSDRCGFVWGVTTRVLPSHCVVVLKMPSDAAKKRQQQKKERKIALDKKRIAEQQSKGKPKTDINGTALEENISSSQNGQTTSDEDSPPTTQKKPEGATASSISNDLKKVVISPRSSTGVLASHPDSRDVHIERLSVAVHGAELLIDAKLELNCGRRYGLVGLNGCG